MVWSLRHINRRVVIGCNVTVQLDSVRTIGFKAAGSLGSCALKMAESMEVSGVVCVYGMTGMPFMHWAYGEGARPMHVEIAKAKARTVLNVRRSTSKQRERMEQGGQSQDHFAGQVLTTLGGGVAVFADEECREFVGAMAFSGGTQEQDEYVCAQAIAHLGLFTDVEIPQTPPLA
ncbi:MAG: heme-binding protein [bacterium]|nr:heme-binding protein [bacterium]